MKYVIFSVFAIFLTGCGQVDKSIAKFTGEPQAVCYQGVEYIQLTSGASVAYNPDGSLRTCSD